MENDINFNLIVFYLDRYYDIINNTIYNKLFDKDEWGYETIEELTQVLSIDEALVKEVVESWVLSKGLPLDKWESAYEPKMLKTIFNPQRRLELERIIGKSAEAQVTAMLAQAIADEIDSEILRMLKKKVKTAELLSELLKCLGYTFGPVYYDPITYAQNRKILTSTEYRMIHEQQNNPYWQDWFRARRQDEETQKSSLLEENGDDLLRW